MPFCPRCKYEYQEWVKVCPDCGATLVAKLPPEPAKPKEEKIITIATYFSPTEAHLNAAKLHSEGIQAVVVDEFSMANFGIGIMVRLHVKEGDADRAIKILELDKRTRKK